MQQEMERSLAKIAPEAVGAIDADVHPYFKEGLHSLAPYLSRAMQERMGLGPKPAYAAALAASDFKIPTLPYYIDGGNTRADNAPPAGGAPGSDPTFLVEDLIERYQMGAVILNGGNAISLGGMPDPDAANAIAAAHNDWIAEEWLAHDKRIHGAIVVAPRDIPASVEEIKRWKNHPGMVQVLIPEISEHAIGHRYFWPIFKAASENGLPVAIHPGGQTAGANASMLPTLASATFAEHWTNLPQVGQGQLISMLLCGAFEQFPDLRYVTTEYGVSWLPSAMWRADAAWKAFRKEVPWARKPPSEYILERCRFTTQPIDEPANRQNLADLFRMIHAERTLLFSTDYPHWDTDLPDEAQKKIPKDLRKRVFQENARAIYPRLRV